MTKDKKIGIAKNRFLVIKYTLKVIEIKMSAAVALRSFLMKETTN